MSYDMAARIAHLIAARNLAISWLQQAPQDRYVRAAIETLEAQPLAGQAGGPAREIRRGRKRPPARRRISAPERPVSLKKRPNWKAA